MKYQDLDAKQKDRESQFCFSKVNRDGKWVDGVLYNGAFEIIAAAPGQLLLEKDGMDGGVVKLVIPLLGQGEGIASMNKEFVGRRVCVTIEYVPMADSEPAG